MIADNDARMAWQELLDSAWRIIDSATRLQQAVEPELRIEIENRLTQVRFLREEVLYRNGAPVPAGIRQEMAALASNLMNFCGGAANQWLMSRTKDIQEAGVRHGDAYLLTISHEALRAAQKIKNSVYAEREPSCLRESNRPTYNLHEKLKDQMEDMKIAARRLEAAVSEDIDTAASRSNLIETALGMIATAQRVAGLQFHRLGEEFRSVQEYYAQIVPAEAEPAPQPAEAPKRPWHWTPIGQSVPNVPLKKNAIS